jgi:hypothetical protein
MSLQSILEDALDAAKRFIKWLLPSSKHLLDIALIAVNAMKNFDTANPEILNTIVSLIPGTVDDTILSKLRSYLPELLVRLKWAENEAGKTPDAIIADAAAFINSLPEAEKSAAWQAIWQLLSNELTDNAVAMNDLQKIGQAYYESTKGA